MKQKRATIIGMVVGVALVLCLGAIATQKILDNERQVSIEQVPPAVKTALLAEAGGGAIKEIEAETEDGRTVYEAEVVMNGVEVDIRVAADGTVLGRESEDKDDDDADDADDDDAEGDHEDGADDEELVSIDAIPVAVKTTILKEAAGRNIEEIVKENEDGQAVYEAEVIVDGKEVDIRVAPDGTLLGTETDEADEDN